MFSINMVNVFSPTIFLNIFFSVAYFITKIQSTIHITHKHVSTDYFYYQ